MIIQLVFQKPHVLFPQHEFNDQNSHTNYSHCYNEFLKLTTIIKSNLSNPTAHTNNIDLNYFSTKKKTFC